MLRVLITLEARLAGVGRARVVDEDGDGGCGDGRFALAAAVDVSAVGHAPAGAAAAWVGGKVPECGNGALVGFGVGEEAAGTPFRGAGAAVAGYGCLVDGTVGGGESEGGTGVVVVFVGSGGFSVGG